ncbi:MAG: hypothetical protein H7Z14_14750 [Anaerolineae bacterium]|nr:hypothetical protein [Phycisphaerae bacterium]
MRSLVVILITIILLAGGFTLYSWMQPARSVRTISSGSTESGNVTPPPATPANQRLPISKGEKVFVESFDNKTGNLSRRFRGATWDPQPDGTVHVQQPEAEFFAADGQVLRVRGERGEIVVPSSGGGSADAMSRAQLPTRGKLYNVQMSLIPAGAKQPALTCFVNNLSFDNDTFLLATEEYKDESGKTVAADQVPVTVRGSEYDFDGRGVIVHWDERDQRLRLLEIAHGESLTVKNPKTLGIATTQPGKVASATAVKATPTTTAAPRDAGVIAMTKQTATTAPTTQPEASPYRATFVENVRIEQGGQQVAQCDQMNIDFLMDAQSSSANEESAATTQPSRGGRKTAKNFARAPQAAATAPAEQPIRVKWSGKLTIQPTPDDVTTPKGKDTIVEMIGIDQPVIAKTPDGELKCASFRLNTNDNSLSVRSSPAIPLVTVKDATGVSITTASFDYSAEHHVAIVKGKSHAEFPIHDANAPTTQPAKPTQIARVNWSDSCTLRTSPTQQRGQMAIEHALLRGDVSVEHPQMTLNSRELELSFDPANPQATTTAPVATGGAKMSNVKIQQMIARDNVRGRFADPTDASAKPQSIDTDTLTVDFGTGADGRSYPAKAVAHGSVRAGDAKSDLRANHLEVTMVPAPATQPAVAGRSDALAPVQVSSLTAQEGVRATSADGQEIQCDQLRMEQTAEGPKYRIVGEESAPARASDGAKSLVGKVIEFVPGAQRASVQGAGSMQGTQEITAANGAPTTQPIEVNWQSGLNADGKANLITISGGIVAKSTLEDGSVTEVLGNKMTIALADSPTNKPAREAPTTQKASGGFSFAGNGADMNSFRDKVFNVATIDSTPEISEVRSTMLADDGSLLRRLHLFAATFQYEPESKRMIVPVPGRMLYEDQRGATTKPADVKTNNRAPGDKLNLRGATAFEWQKELIYDDAARQATMSGDVDVVHRGAADSTSYRMRAQRIVANLMPAEDGAARSDKSSPAEAKLKRLVADGGVTFTSSNLQFIAYRVEFDPDKHRLIARGTDRAPATLLDAGGLSQGTFTDLYYDTQLDRFRTENFRATVRRTGGSSLTGSGADSEK